MEPPGAGFAAEMRREIAIIQFNTSLIMAELKHLRKLAKEQAQPLNRKRKALSIESEDEDSDETLTSDTEDEDEDDDEDEDENKGKGNIRPRRSKRHQSSASPDPCPDPLVIDYSEIRGELRLHKDDGPYISGFLDAGEQDGIGPSARIRWLKPLNSDPDCRTFVFCDWPAQIVDLINPSTRPAVGAMTQSGQMMWDHTETGPGSGPARDAAAGFLEAPFEVLPYFYQYGSGLTVDFTPVLKYMSTNASQKLSGREAKTRYLMALVDLVCECYQGPGCLYAFGTRTESDHESNLELAHMACQTRGAAISAVLTPCTDTKVGICDCCNKRSRKVASLMHLDACCACCRIYQNLVSITDAMVLPGKKMCGSEICAAFARLMYVLADTLV